MASQSFWRRALADPGWIAAIEPDGTSHTAGDLLARVNQLTHGLQARGLRPGDGLAILAPNGIAPLEVYLSALQAGWYLTPINWHFTAPEIAYILRDCEAKVFFVHERFAAAGAEAAGQAGIPASGRLSLRTVPGFLPVEDVRDGQPAELPRDRTAGATMHYTSGTTGRPRACAGSCPVWTRTTPRSSLRCCRSCSALRPARRTCTWSPRRTITRRCQSSAVPPFIWGIALFTWTGGTLSARWS